MKAIKSRSRIKVENGKGPKRIALTKQQASQITTTQQNLQAAQLASNMAMEGALAAAGIEPGTVQVVGGNVGPKDPHLLIRYIGEPEEG